LLTEHPGLASEQIHDTRTPLMVTADWPGYFPPGPPPSAWTKRDAGGVAGDPTARQPYRPTWSGFAMRRP
jgi:hypothetical protein